MRYLTLNNHQNWQPLVDFRRDMERLFDDYWPSDDWSRMQPAYNLEESPDHYLITFDMPGVPKDQLKVEVQDNQLTVTGERRTDDKKFKGYGSFRRAFALPAGIDSGKVEADYQDGVLKVYLPKAESAKPRQVKIGSQHQGFFAQLISSKADPSKGKVA